MQADKLPWHQWQGVQAHRRHTATATKACKVCAAVREQVLVFIIQNNDLFIIIINANL